MNISGPFVVPCCFSSPIVTTLWRAESRCSHLRPPLRDSPEVVRLAWRRAKTANQTWDVIVEAHFATVWEALADTIGDAEAVVQNERTP